MGTNRLTAAAAFTVLLAAGPVSAQDGEGKARLALVPGKEVRFVLTFDREGKEEGGLDARMRAAGVAVPEDRLHVVEERSVEILGPEEGEGKTGIRAMVRFGRISVRCADLTGKPREMLSDAKVPEGILLMTDALKAIAPGGAALPVLLDAGGVPLSVEPPAGLEEERLKVLGLDKDARFFLAAHLSGASLLPRMNPPLSGAPLPAKPVGPGDRWEAAPFLLEGAAGVQMTLLQTLRVEAVDAAEVRLSATGRVEARLPGIALQGKELEKKLKELLGEPPVVKKSSATAELRLSRADGLPLSASGDVSWETLGKSPGDKKKTTTKVKVRWTLVRK